MSVERYAEGCPLHFQPPLVTPWVPGCARKGNDQRSLLHFPWQGIFVFETYELLCRYLLYKELSCVIGLI